MILTPTAALPNVKLFGNPVVSTAGFDRFPHDTVVVQIYGSR
ncbi:hypothetical protein C8J36_11098 [Rhizobium sp. PP-F2F-G48]|nr:hypothetical protein C8J36_11098 [Rhizobium sp. PP-F2F-G48]